MSAELGTVLAVVVSSVGLIWHHWHSPNLHWLRSAIRYIRGAISNRRDGIATALVIVTTAAMVLCLTCVLPVMVLHEGT